MIIKSVEVKKTFNKVELFSDITFEARSGVNLILGKNGCGKTTWIKMALGLESMTAGVILFDDKKIEQVRDEIAIVFDEPPVYDYLNGYDNLYYLSGGKKLTSQTTKEIIESLQLPDSLLKKKCKTYSLGQRHRLSVASAFIRNANYIIMDEPSVGLDLDSWQLVKNRILMEASLGKVIILTGHSYELLEEITDRVIVMNDNKIILEEKLSKLIDLAECTLEIVAQNNIKQLVELGFSCKKNNVFFKKYPTTMNAELELIEIQKKGIMIEKIKYSSNGLKDIYRTLVSGEI